MLRHSWSLLLALGLGCPGAKTPSTTAETATEGDTDTPIDTDTSLDTDTPIDTGTSIDTDTEVDPFACVDEQLPSTVPATVHVQTAGQGDDLAGPWPCSAGNGEEYVFRFQASADGRYSFDTIGSDFDTLLVLLDQCDGKVLACSDDQVPSVDPTSRAWLDLTAGQEVVIVVDSVDSAGNATVNIALVPPSETLCDDGLDDDADGAADCADTDCALDPVCTSTCPDLVAAGAPTSVSGTTLYGADQTQGSCDLVGGGVDVTVEFTAPAAATYGFELRTSGTDHDAVLYVTDGCGGAELACDDAPGFGGDVVVLALIAGQTVTAVVDGAGSLQLGDFDLYIAEVAADEAACADGVDEDFDATTDCLDDQCLGSPSCDVACPENVIDGFSATFPIVVQGSNLGKGNAHAGSCGGATGSETTYLFAAPFDTYTISTAGSPSDTVLYVLQGNCSAAELVCNDDFGGAATSEVTAAVGADLPRVIVVDSADQDGGDFTLTISN